MKGREPSGKTNPSIPLTSDPLPRLAVGPGVSRGRRRIQQRRKRQPKASPSRGCSKRLGGAFRRTACKVEWTARATATVVALAVPVDGELEATERGGDGRHRALTCTKQGQLPFEDDSCPCLSICEVFFVVHQSTWSAETLRSMTNREHGKRPNRGPPSCVRFQPPFPQLSDAAAG